MDEQEQTLASLFDAAFNKFIALEDEINENGENVEASVEKCIRDFEKATEFVNLQGLFSVNESLEDVSTSNIRYLLLPAFLGRLSQKLTKRDRAEILNMTLTYYKDFLKRVCEYGLLNREESSAVVEASAKANTTDIDELLRLSRIRTNKIEAYNERKALQEKYTGLQTMIKSGSADDETEREFYLTLLRYWINCVQDELPSVEEEIKIVQFMKEMKKDDSKPAPVRTVPLKPFIITRSEQQKKVYGLGYPSVPVMTVNEFVAKRYPEGDQTAADYSNLLERAMNQDIAKAEFEKEDIQREEDLEKDHPELLKYNRDFDDWKDDHRRGEGNRINKG